MSAVAFRGRSADDALAACEASPDRAAIRAIALGTIRWYLRIAPAVNALLTRPAGVAEEIRALLAVSAHQFEYSRNAPQVTAHAAVDATRILRQPNASGLVNAVLRRFVAERGELLAHVDRDVATRAAHPEWLVRRLGEVWPAQLDTILEANNAHPPMVLRVDLTRTTVDAYIAELSAAEIEASPVPWAPAAIRLARPMSVGSLPGFREGRVSVQDAGAQLAAPFLAAEKGMRVLDACAAPGGKTGHLLEYTPALAELVALDIDGDRIERVRENLQRLSRTATLVVGDARNPGPLGSFDRILVDAPCSSTGVIRRHPDIKLLRRAEDIPAMAATQLRILEACFGLLATGGRLLYVTCSVLPEENEGVVSRFLKDQPAARPTALAWPHRRPADVADRTIGLQVVPGGQAGSDGFYYACLEKTTAGT